MIIRVAIIAALFGLSAAPAFAQFPPPGVYQCIDLDGKPFGILMLLVGGDYQFESDATIGGSGQVASSGNSVNAVSGPLADIDLSGSFTPDPTGNPVFMFGTTLGGVMCALPAR